MGIIRKLWKNVWKTRPALLCLSPYPYGQLYKGRADQRTEKYKEDILEVVPLFPSQDREEEKGSFLEKSFQELFVEYYTERRGVEPEAELLETLTEIIEKEKEYETDLDKD